MSRASVIEDLFGPKRHHVSPYGSGWSRDMSKLGDDELWRRFLRRRRLKAAQVRRLEAVFPLTNAGLEDSEGRRRGEPERMRNVRLRDWILDVLAIEVEHRPGGLTVLRAPDPPPTAEIHAPYKVEIRWVFDPGTNARRPWEVRIVADEFLEEWGAVPSDMQLYFQAFALEPGREPVERLPRRRPAAGKPLDVDWYERLLAQYEALVAEGHRAPAAELARRYGENPSTVKSWLRRGRGYLEGRQER